MSKIKQSLLSIVIGLALAAGISYAAPWVGPTANPPGNNVEAPINAGDSDQIKGGGVSFGSLISRGGAIFEKRIKIADSSASPSAGEIRWTGTDFEGYDGTQWKSFTADTTGGGKIFKVITQQFLSSGTFTVPAKVTQVWVSLSGGGGGGGGGAQLTREYIDTPGGGGGGGQEIILKQISVSSGANIPITAGAGGLGGASGYYNIYSKTLLDGKDGASGGASSFGGFVSVVGGGGGKIGVIATTAKYPPSIPGLGGAPNGQQGRCEIGSIKFLCYIDSEQGFGFADRYGGGGGGGGRGAGYYKTGSSCVLSEGQTICSPTFSELSLAGAGSFPGGGGGGGVVNPAIVKTGYVSYNGANGGGGYVTVYWCPDGLVPIDGKIENGFCQAK